MFARVYGGSFELPEVEKKEQIPTDEYSGVWVWVEQYNHQAGSISWEMMGEGENWLIEEEQHCRPVSLDIKQSRLPRQAMPMGRQGFPGR
jgi:hypothetical protein